MATNPRDLTTVQNVMNWMNANNQAYKQEEQNVIQTCITAASLNWIRWTGRPTLNRILPFNERYDGSGSDRQFLKQSPILKVFSVMVNGTSIPASSDGINSPGYWISDDRESLIIIGATSRIPVSAPFGMSGTNYRVFGNFGFTMGRQNVFVSYLAGYTLEPAEPNSITNGTYTVVNTSQFVIDMGVTYVQTGVPFTAVPSAPSQGQYSVNASGVYTFNASDNGTAAVFSYGYNGVPTDIQEAMNMFVAQNYKRRQTVDEKSKIMAGAGTTTYRDWVMPPQVERTLQAYKRQALLYG